MTPTMKINSYSMCVRNILLIIDVVVEFMCVCRTQYASAKPCVCACFGAMFNNIQRNRAKVVAVQKQKTVPNKTNTKKGMYFHCCHRNSIICRMGPGKGWSQTEKRTCGSEKKVCKIAQQQINNGKFSSYTPGIRKRKSDGKSGGESARADEEVRAS